MGVRVGDMKIIRSVQKYQRQLAGIPQRRNRENVGEEVNKGKNRRKFSR